MIGEHNFQVECKVEHLRKPVSTLIIAQVFEISSKVVYIDSEGQETIMREKGVNVIDVGQVS